MKDQTRQVMERCSSVFRSVYEKPGPYFLSEGEDLQAMHGENKEILL